LFLFLVSSQENCMFTDEATHQTFDLSELANEEGDYQVHSLLQPNLTYKFNFCGFTKEPPCSSTSKALAFRETIQNGVVQKC